MKIPVELISPDDTEVESVTVSAFVDFPPGHPRRERYKKETIPFDLRWSIWERDNFTCQSCGSRSNLAVDHILAESKGGTLDPENLQTLCKPCNSRKGNR